MEFDASGEDGNNGGVLLTISTDTLSLLEMAWIWQIQNRCGNDNWWEDTIVVCDDWSFMSESKE